MKKRMAFLICAVIIAGAAIVCALMFLNEAEEGDEHAESVQRVVTDVTLEQEGGYVIKNLNGRVAVYDALDMKEPVQVTEIYLETLRSYDQELLEKGIELENQEALLRILEDFGS